MRAVFAIAVMFGGLALYAQAQTAPAYVATIKVSGNAPGKMIGVRNLPNGIHAEKASLATLIRYANGYTRFPSDDRILNLPAWAEGTTFDVDAKMDDADVTKMQTLSADEQDAMRQQMEQAFLAERFHLKSHRETRQRPIFELTVVGEPKLQPTDEAAMAAEAAAIGRSPARSTMSFAKDSTIARGYTMEGFAGYLSSGAADVGRPVVDKTGLAGRYDFTLRWHPSIHISMGGVADMAFANPDGDSIFKALGDLGLKLRPVSGPVDVIVIDAVEKPSEN